MAILIKHPPKPHQFAGMVLCRRHLEEMKYDADPMVDVEEIDEPCVMCTTRPVEGNHCENYDCRKPLHPQWPSVYCSNECAITDL